MEFAKELQAFLGSQPSEEIPPDVRDRLEALLVEYDVDRESLASDLSRFLSELRDAGIVEEA
jgi:hypothetical protein